MKEESPESDITGTDFSENMLEVAKNKTKSITWEIQDVMALPYEDNSFNCSSISYGIRNVENYHKALTELARVSTDKICILEFGQPQNPIFKFIYFGLMKYFIPLMGKLFNKREAYEYLIHSSMKFPCAEDFCTVIKKTTGFKTVKYKPFFGGITYLYTASNK
jgi:demethylmenaquinone methyltransferase/2-methoxy-6-polyprenyl-1,4-benzoquinol methylase